ncbi:MAG: hypothetical protein R2771_09365 [Saprospiraceae bacterium]
MKKIFFIFAVLSIITLVIFSCTDTFLNTNDNLETDQSTLITRSRTLGNYSVVDGRLAFPTVEDYLNTIDYLNGATEAELLSFRSSFQLVTSAKIYDEFYELINLLDTNATEMDYTNIENQYSDLISITESEGEKIYEPKYSIYPELTNLNGEIQVNTSIIKFLGNKVISVTRPDIIDIGTINDNTKTDYNIGVIVENIVSDNNIDNRSSCPLKYEHSIMYDSEKRRKRVRIKYENYGLNLIGQYTGKDYHITAVIGTKAHVYSEMHKNRVLYWSWGNFKVDELRLEFEQILEHNLGDIEGIPITNPLVINKTLTKYNENHIKFADEISGFYTSRSTIPIELKVKKVHIKGIRVDNGIFDEFSCTE